MPELEELLAAWAALSAHAIECDRCEKPVEKLRDGAQFEVTWGSLCDSGRHLSEAWLAATEAWLGTRRPTQGSFRVVTG